MTNFHKLTEDEAIAAGHSRSEWQATNRIATMPPEGSVPGLNSARAKIEKATAAMAAAETAFAEAAQLQRDWEARLQEIETIAARLRYARGQAAHWREVLAGQEAKLYAGVIGDKYGGGSVHLPIAMMGEICALRALLAETSDRWLPEQTAALDRLVNDAEDFARQHGIKANPRPALNLESP